MQSLTSRYRLCTFINARTGAQGMGHVSHIVRLASQSSSCHNSVCEKH